MDVGSSGLSGISNRLYHSITTRTVERNTEQRHRKQHFKDVTSELKCSFLFSHSGANVQPDSFLILLLLPPPPPTLGSGCRENVMTVDAGAGVGCCWMLLDVATEGRGFKQTARIDGGPVDQWTSVSVHLVYGCCLDLDCCELQVLFIFD